MTLRIAALVKQIPAFEEMALGPDGRLRRDDVELELSAYCRRAVAQAVSLIHDHGGHVTVLTLGPPSAEDALREALAWAAERGVDATGVLVTDPAFAGSDTLATAKALTAALRRTGPFDLVVFGRNSVDADTGQVGPEVAELLGLPFATGVRELSLAEGILDLRCEHDDGWSRLRVSLPAALSCAERLIEPCKIQPEDRRAVPADRIQRLDAATLGSGPWGEAASPTRVGRTRVHDVAREQYILDGPLDEQVRAAVDLLRERGALADSAGNGVAASVPPPAPVDRQPTVAVVVEPDRAVLTAELLGAAAQLARDVGGHVVAIGTEVGPERAAALAGQGADALVRIDAGDAPVEEDVARGIYEWVAPRTPWAILAPSTTWGREVASRVAVRLDAGLTGDAVALETSASRLVAWKPAFGGQLVAEITTSSPAQLATVRIGVLDHLVPRPVAESPPVETIVVDPRSRTVVISRTRDDDLDALAEADVVVGVGQAVPPDAYTDLDGLLGVLGAELAATRKVTDKGWLPRSRQVGITGRSINPRLYVALGVGGKFNHVVGVRGAGTIMAVNRDRDAPVFAAADVGVVGDWREVVPLLVAELERVPAELPDC